MDASLTTDGGGIRWDDPGLAAVRRDMLRFAQIQLRDAAVAEDMVQEALLAAMNHTADFAGRSAVKTWLFAILRNKIVDHLRKSSREVTASEIVADGEDEPDFDRLFRESGHWQPAERPAAWADPDAAFTQKEFWQVFDACVNHLPERLARVYMMREFLELETAEICAQLGITTNNCWVILHRARTALRECLEDSWFHGGSVPC